jgi:hypothetical protein
MRTKLAVAFIATILMTVAASNLSAQQNVRPMAPLNLIINPLGFLQAGPIVDLEIQVSPGLYVLLHTRFHGLGLLSHLLEASGSSSGTEDIQFYSVAFGTGLRYLFVSQNSRNAPYLGFIVEYGYNPYFDNTYDYTGTSTYINLAANAGYRWRFDSFLLEVGAYLGAAPTLTSEWYYNATPSVKYAGTKTTTFFAMVELSIGFEL